MHFGVSLEVRQIVTRVMFASCRELAGGCLTLVLWSGCVSSAAVVAAAAESPWTLAQSCCSSSDKSNRSSNNPEAGLGRPM